MNTLCNVVMLCQRVRRATWGSISPYFPALVILHILVQFSFSSLLALAVEMRGNKTKRGVST